MLNTPISVRPPATLVVACLAICMARAHVSGLEQAPAATAPDLAAYARIRDEGLSRSKVMDYATELLDGIGPRLTGSPNLKKAID
jgi:carboxypeptidase Q